MEITKIIEEKYPELIESLNNSPYDMYICDLNLNVLCTNSKVKLSEYLRRCKPKDISLPIQNSRTVDMGNDDFIMINPYPDSRVQEYYIIVKMNDCEIPTLFNLDLIKGMPIDNKNAILFIEGINGITDTVDTYFVVEPICEYLMNYKSSYAAFDYHVENGLFCRVNLAYFIIAFNEMISNAVLCGPETGKLVYVDGYKKNDEIYIDVHDNCTFVDIDELNKMRDRDLRNCTFVDKYGIRTLQDFTRFYGYDFEFVKSRYDGTCARLKIPYAKKPSDSEMRTSVDYSFYVEIFKKIFEGIAGKC